MNSRDITITVREGSLGPIIVSLNKLGQVLQESANAGINWISVMKPDLYELLNDPVKMDRELIKMDRELRKQRHYQRYRKMMERMKHATRTRA